MTIFKKYLNQEAFITNQEMSQHSKKKSTCLFSTMKEYLKVSNYQCYIIEAQKNAH